MKNLLIKERIGWLNELKTKENDRHAKRHSYLNDIFNKIQKDCRHPTIKTLQTSPESIDICSDCGKVIR